MKNIPISIDILFASFLFHKNRKSPTCAFRSCLLYFWNTVLRDWVFGAIILHNITHKKKLPLWKSKIFLCIFWLSVSREKKNMKTWYIKVPKSRSFLADFCKKAENLRKPKNFYSSRKSCEKNYSYLRYLSL